MSKFMPNRAQAINLRQRADDGSDSFGEKVSNYERLHDQLAKEGRSSECPCSGCS